MIKNSKLSDHEFKKGKFTTPINAALKDLLKENPWFQERLPEYLWIALILEYYGRKEGLKKCFTLINKISEYNTSNISIKFSDILNSPIDKQKELYNYFLEFIDKEVLCPLTAIFTYTENTIFSTYFITNLSLNERIKIINMVFNKTSDHQSELSTDIRFLIIYYKSLIYTLCFASSESQELFFKYPTLSHNDEEMRIIRPLIRAMEVGFPDDKNINYLNIFWERVSQLSECELYTIEISDNHKEAEEYITNDMVMSLTNYIALTKVRKL